MGDERCRVYLAFGYKAQYLLTVAAVDTAGLEREILSVHVWKGQCLRMVVKRHHRDDGVRTRALPRHAERVIAPRHLNHHIRATVETVFRYDSGAVFRTGDNHSGIMAAHEGGALPRFLAHDDASRALQHDAQQGADARRSGSDDEHSVVRINLRYARSPVSCGEDVAREESLFVAYAVGYAVESLSGMRHTDILSLSSVDAATESPASVGVLAVVHVALTAEETFAAEGLHIHCHSVARSDVRHLRACLFHYAHHLMTYGDARYGARNTAVLYVQVARADAPERHPHDGVARVLQFGHGFFCQSEVPFSDVSICQHCDCLLSFPVQYYNVCLRVTLPLYATAAVMPLCRRMSFALDMCLSVFQR